MANYRNNSGNTTARLRGLQSRARAGNTASGPAASSVTANPTPGAVQATTAGPNEIATLKDGAYRGAAYVADNAAKGFIRSAAGRGANKLIDMIGSGSSDN